MSKFGKIFILGDSYSTFAGYNPEGYALYYGVPNDTDVTAVEETWWHRLATRDGAEIVRNCSFSGTTVCNTGYGGYCPDSSFIGRFDRLVAEGFFDENEINTIFVLGGTNDAWVPSPFGEVQYEGWDDESLRQALPAFCYLMHRIKECLPDARVVNILNDVVIGGDIIDGYREASRHYGVQCVNLGDFDRATGHPTVLGMKQIADIIYSEM